MQDIMVTIAGPQKMRRFYLICLPVLMLAFILALPISPVYAETYTYDTTGRLTMVAYDDGSSITYNYDNTGNLLQQAIFIEMALADVILVLQVLSGIEPAPAVYKEADVDGDNKIGLEEVIYILQKVSGLR